MSLYDDLGLKSTATLSQIKKAFRSLALIHHPDKQSIESGHESGHDDGDKSKHDVDGDKSKHQVDGDKGDGNDTFKVICHAYGILSDPQTRQKYDETGSVADLVGDASWKEYFETLFDQVTNDSIDAYSKTFRYSEEERSQVLDAYNSTKGSLLDMLEMIVLSTLDDLDRFKGICQDAIDSGSVQKYAAFPKISKLKLKRMRAEMEAEAKQVSNVNASDENALGALIRGKQQDRHDALIASLEAKYSKDSNPYPKTNSKAKAKKEGVAKKKKTKN